MVPAYLAELPAMPVLAGGKVDRRNLPATTSSAAAGRPGWVTPRHAR